jgi:hypothetical protein
MAGQIRRPFFIHDSNANTLAKEFRQIIMSIKTLTLERNSCPGAAVRESGKPLNSPSMEPRLFRSCLRYLFNGER